MQSVSYYQTQAQKAEWLSDQVSDERAKAELLKIAEDYRDIAKDLESGAIEIRHRDRLPQLQHPRS